MLQKARTRLYMKYVQFTTFLADPKSERGQNLTSFSSMSAIVLVIILALMAIFRDSLTGVFHRIAGLLGGI